MQDEKQPGYVTDALEMAGIDLSAPKKIIQELSGFVPVFDAVIARYHDETRAMVHGAMWRYCQMEDGVCRASLTSIANMIGVKDATVSRHAEVLCADGYFKDLTPNLKNKPHVYADTGKIVMRSKISGLAQDSSGGTQNSASGTESRLNKVLNKDSNKSSADAEKTAKQKVLDSANREVDYILQTALGPKAIQDAMATFFQLTPNWDGNKTNRQWMQWAIGEKITAAQIEHAANLWRFDKRFNWQHFSLKGIQEHWLTLRGNSSEQRTEADVDSNGAVISW